MGRECPRNGEEVFMWRTKLTWWIVKINKFADVSRCHVMNPISKMINLVIIIGHVCHVMMLDETHPPCVLSSANLVECIERMANLLQPITPLLAFLSCTCYFKGIYMVWSFQGYLLTFYKHGQSTTTCSTWYTYTILLTLLRTFCDFFKSRVRVKWITIKLYIAYSRY